MATQQFFTVEGREYALHPSAPGSHHVIATLLPGHKHWTFLYQNDPEMLEWNTNFAKFMEKTNPKGTRSMVVLVVERERV